MSGTTEPLLQIVADLLLGGRHSRNTIARASGKSLPTADRWFAQIAKTIPGINYVKVGKTGWIEYRGKP